MRRIAQRRRGERKRKGWERGRGLRRRAHGRICPTSPRAGGKGRRMAGLLAYTLQDVWHASQARNAPNTGLWRARPLARTWRSTSERHRESVPQGSVTHPRQGEPGGKRALTNGDTGAQGMVPHACWRRSKNRRDPSTRWKPLRARRPRAGWPGDPREHRVGPDGGARMDGPGDARGYVGQSEHTCARALQTAAASASSKVSI